MFGLEPFNNDFLEENKIFSLFSELFFDTTCSISPIISLIITKFKKQGGETEWFITSHQLSKRIHATLLLIKRRYLMTVISQISA